MSDEAIDHMRRVRQQIARIDEQNWDLDTRVTLETLCDTLIEILQSGGTMDHRVMAKKFIGIMNQLIYILQGWQTRMTSFRNFVGDKVEDAKSAQSRGNQSQVIWTGINCVANGAGLVALFVPGLNVPLMVFGVGGSILGVWGRIQSDKHIKEEFANIMSDIENHKDYSLISFSDLMKQKQNEFEEKRNRLMNHFGYNLNGANSVAIIEMIIDCMLTRRLFGPHERKGIKGEVTMDIVAQLKSTVSFLFERYGKHAFNFVDDTFELTLGTMKGLSGAVVAFTFALNFYQLYTEMNEREANVAKIEKMKQVLQNGTDSVQFFVNTLNEFRARLYEASQDRMEEELDMVRDQLQQHQRYFQAIGRLIRRDNTFEVEASELNSIEFPNN